MVLFVRCCIRIINIFLTGKGMHAKTQNRFLLICLNFYLLKMNTALEEYFS